MGFIQSRAVKAVATATLVLGVLFPAESVLAAIGTPTSLGSANPTSAGGSVSITLSTGVSIGNTVIVTAAIDGSSNTVTVSDTKGNTYTKDADINNNNGSGGIRIVVFSAPVTVALVSGNSITLSLGTPSQHITMRAMSVSGISTPKDVSNTGTADSGTAASSGSVTNTSANELFIGALGASFSPTNITAGFGWTSLGAVQSPATGTSLLPMYQIVSSISSHAATGTLSGSDAWSAAIVGYKATPSNATLTLVKSVTNDNGGTAVDTAWTLTATGPTNISGASGAAAVTGATVTAGTYTLGETGGPSGYTAGTYSCVVNGGGAISSNSITLVANDVATCTVNNDDQPGHIKIVKNTTGGNGSFSFNVNGPSSSILTFATSGGTASSTINVNAGGYSVTETVPSGWQFNSASCDNGSVITNGVGSISVANGATVTCTFSDTKLGSITVTKKVVAPDGTTEVPSDTHQFTVTLGSDSESIAEGSPHTFSDLTPGTQYTLTESTDSNYTFLSATDENLDQAGIQATVNAGQDTAVTITNEQKQGSLTVSKHVNNTHGIGTSVAANFTLTLTPSTNVSPSSFPGDEGGTSITLYPGTYTLSETGPTGYAPTFSGTCSESDTFTITSGQTGANCTLTNTDLPDGEAALIVTKVVVNDNGGTATSGDFTLRYASSSDPVSVDSGDINYLNPGSYTVSEGTLPENLTGKYKQTSLACTKDGDPMSTDGGTFSVVAGSVYRCTITNDDIGPSLTIEKIVVNNLDNEEIVYTYVGTSSASAWTVSASSSGNANLGFSGAGEAASSSMQAGTYTLSESGGPDGYTAGSWSCTGVENDGSTITLGLGDSAVCKITNTAQPAHLTIAKYTDNGSGDGNFQFQVSGTDEGSTFHKLLELETSGGAATTTIAIPAGNFNVDETGFSEGWNFAGVSCTYDNGSVGSEIEFGEHIFVGNGDSVTCTFHDTTKAVLTVKKIVNNAHGKIAIPSDFTFSIDGLSTTTFNRSGENDFIVNAGTYNVAETEADGYTVAYSGKCSNVTLKAGDTATCTTTNSDVDASTPAPTNNGGGGGGGGTNGPIAGSTGGGGQVLGASTTTVPGGNGGQVLGASTSTAPQATSTPPTGPSCDSVALLTKYMRMGQPNDPVEVKKLQQFLNTYEGANLPTTGFFGPSTDAAVRAFQKKYAADVLNPWGITDPTGYVYKTTLWKINSIICASLNAPKPDVSHG